MFAYVHHSFLYMLFLIMRYYYYMLPPAWKQPGAQPPEENGETLFRTAIGKCGDFLLVRPGPSTI